MSKYGLIHFFIQLHWNRGDFDSENKKCWYKTDLKIKFLWRPNEDPLTQGPYYENIYSFLRSSSWNLENQFCLLHFRLKRACWLVDRTIKINNLTSRESNKIRQILNVEILQKPSQGTHNALTAQTRAPGQVFETPGSDCHKGSNPCNNHVLFLQTWDMFFRFKKCTFYSRMHFTSIESFLNNEIPLIVECILLPSSLF